MKKKRTLYFTKMINSEAIINKTIDNIENVLWDINNCSFEHVQKFKIPSKALFNKAIIQKLFKELSKIKGRFIYVIDTEGGHESSRDINWAYSRFNKTNKPRIQGKTFNMSRFNVTESKTLYVGTSKSINTRIKQHLGYGDKRIYSLGLRHWFPKNIDLILNIYKVSTENQFTIELIEQSIWDVTKPQFGKRSGL